MYKFLIPALILFIIYGIGTLYLSSVGELRANSHPIVTSEASPPLTPTPTVAPTPTPAPVVFINQPTGNKVLPTQKFVYQTFNNCGPANLSMLLSFYGVEVSQQEIADEIRPFQHPRGVVDDKSTTLDELGVFAQKYNLVPFKRANGDLEKLKVFLENDIPILTVTWLNAQGGFGHYRIIKGYDDKRQVIIEDDSIYGLNKTLSYNEFLKLWQVFNYQYLVLVPQEKEELVKAILKDEQDIKVSYVNALLKAEEQIKQNPGDIFAYFNQSTNFYHLEEYEKSIQVFEKVQSKLPQKMLWYQIEPILSYKQLKNYQKVLSLTEGVFKSGNLAASELYLARGEVYLEQGERDLAKKELEKALLYNKNSQPVKQALEKLN